MRTRICTPEGEAIVDTALMLWINSHHTASLDLLFWWLSAVTDLYLLWWLLGLAALGADRENGRAVLLRVLLALLLVYITVDLIIKPVAARPRPFAVLEGVRQLSVSWLGKLVPLGFSFPSGHCASSAAAAWIMGSSYRRLRLPLGMFVGLVAYSRVYVGVHYPADCIAGLAVGILCGVLVRVVLPERASFRRPGGISG
jgi:undecaprenyl-diphosphatase